MPQWHWGFLSPLRTTPTASRLQKASREQAKGHSVVVGITLGTGVGGGIVIDGKIFTGAHGYAAEIGHMLLRPGETPYPMEHPRGDAEEFLSGTAMGKRCKAAENPQEYLEGSVCSFLQPQVFEEVAWLCTSLTHLLDPSVIVFGGSAGERLDLIWRRSKKNYRSGCFPEFRFPNSLSLKEKMRECWGRR